MNRAIFREGLKQKNMENNTELLKEYASLAGREDAKSEARKAEILSYIKAHANDADREEAKAFIGQKMEQIKDNVEVLRKDDAANGFQCFFVCQNGNGNFLQGGGYRCTHQRPPALPNIAALYSGAMTCKRYRSLPQRYRQVPLSGYLISSNSDGSTCKASIYSLGLICPALNRN